MKRKTILKLALIGWMLPLIGGLSLFASWMFKKGANAGREELITQLNQPELRMMHFREDEVQLIMIKQRMALGDLSGQRVEIDARGIDGIEAERLGTSGSGTYGYFEEVSVWRIVNKTDGNLNITEKQFTNLPKGFKLPKEFDDAFSIPPDSKSEQAAAGDPVNVPISK